MGNLSKLRSLPRRKIVVGGRQADVSLRGKTFVQCEVIECVHNSFSVNGRPMCMLSKIRVGEQGKCVEMKVWGR